MYTKTLVVMVVGNQQERRFLVPSPLLVEGSSKMAAWSGAGLVSEHVARMGWEPDNV